MIAFMLGAAPTYPDPSVAASRLAASAWALMRRHAAGIAVALMLAVMLTGPRWWLLATDPAEGDRVQLSPGGAGTFGYDQSLYTPNIRQAYDGRLPLSSLYGEGGVDTPVQTGSLWLAGIGLLGRATGGIFASLALVTTLAAITAFLLFYAMGVELTGSRLAAIAVMPIAMLGVEVITQANGISTLRHWPVLKPVVTVDPGLDFHAWARFVAPIMPLPAFFGSVVAVPRAVEHGRRGWIVAAAACLAVLVYSYLFYWTAMALALALWGAWLLYRRDYAAARRLVVIGGIAALLAVPELASAAHNAISFSADMKHRLGIGTPAADDRPTLSSIIQRFIVGVPFMAMLLRGPDRNRLYIALFVVPLVLARAPGVLPQPFHYTLQVWPAFAIPAFVAGGAALWQLLSHQHRSVASVALSVVAILGVVHLGVFQVRAARNVNDAFSMRADERAAFDWIDRNVPDGDAIVSPSVTTNLYIAALTSASKYVKDGFIAAPSDDELVDRYLRTQAAYGFSEDVTFARIDPIYRCKTPDDYRCAKPSSNFPFKDVSPVVREREAALETNMAYYLLNWEITHPDTIESRIPAWRERYRALQSQSGPLSAYRADYLYCGPRERLWPAEADVPATSVTVAYQQGEVTLYRIAAASDAGAMPFRGC
jgi:hypothetical protein